MTHTQYIHALIVHNYRVLVVKYIYFYIATIDTISKAVFLLLRKGTSKDYREQALVNALSYSNEFAPGVRSPYNDFVFLHKLLPKLGLKDDTLTAVKAYFTPTFYQNFSKCDLFLDYAMRYNKTDTGKEFLDFVSHTTGVVRQAMRHRLGDELFSQIYLDTPVEELYDLFSSYTPSSSQKEQP